LRQQATAVRGTAPAARWLGFLQHILEKSLRSRITR
jgi:hypothetical protein